MTSLLRLHDDELQLVLFHLRLWDSLQLKKTCKHFEEMVPLSLRLRKTIDFSWPLPFEEVRSAALLKNVQKLILSTVGPNLVKLVVNDSYEAIEVFADQDFVIELAKRCPKLACLPIGDLESQLRYCELNRGHVEKLEMSIETNDAESDEMRKKILDSCLSASTRLKELNLICENFADTDDIEHDASLLRQLPQLNRFYLITDRPSTELFGRSVTCLEVLVSNINFRFDFLASFPKLVELRVHQQPTVEVLNQLVDKLPNTVTKLKASVGDDVQFEGLMNLIKHRGNQLEKLDVILFGANYISYAQSFLVGVAQRCPKLTDLVVLARCAVESPEFDCSEEFELVTSQLKNIRKIDFIGSVISQSAFECCLFHCRHLKQVRLSLFDSNYDRLDLKRVLDNHHTIYQAYLVTSRNMTLQMKTKYFSTSTALLFKIN
ncbi:hypothetical protein HDE_00962 [Halotydeus destructor]|nr:hypothetical protein HDE_00962 [Halotydeus destructor]